MAENVSDEAFARVLNQMGIVTLDQIEEAKTFQADSAKKGVLLSLPDVLIQQGRITPSIRENVEKKLQAQQAGGVQMLGSYKLLKKLGEGGMGAVYLAEDTMAQRQVALKVLPKKHASDPEFLTRFRREAKATGALNHVNIVGAYTVGEEMGHHFIVMEYCDGESLDRLLKRDGPLPWDKGVEIIMQIARGLKHAHDSGFIHRDIKPANIVLTASGVAKILDLGLSKNIGSGEQSFNTQTGVALGTPHYISPEQARGDKTIDGRTDIYSLGATFYHLVTGQTPFEGSTAAIIMMKHLSEQLPNPQDVNEDLPDGVAHVIRKMMAKEPNDRYRGCKELLDDLELVIDGKSPSSKAIDPGKSSIAVRMRFPAPRRGTAQHGPVVHKRAMAQHEPVADRAVSKKPSDPTMMYVGIGGGVLALGVILLLMMGGNSDTQSRDRNDPSRDRNDPSRDRKGAVTAPLADARGSEPKAPSTGTPETGTRAPDIPSVAAKPPEPAKTATKPDVVQPGTRPAAIDDPERWKDAIDLLALVDPTRDPVSGTWTMKAGDGLLSGDDQNAKAQLPYRPPEEYDVRCVLTRREGNDSAALVLTKGNQAFDFRIAGWGNRVSGFSLLNGKKADANSSRHERAQGWITNGRSYTVIVQVRHGGPRALLDGETICEWKTDFADLSRDSIAVLPDSCALGLITYRSIYCFHRIEVLEITGRGTFTRPDDPAAKEAKKKQDEVWAKRERTGAAQPDAGALPKEMSLDLGGGVKMEMVLVKAGELDMGSSDGDGNEKPVHKVKISKPYYIGKYDVTVAQFRAFADAMKFQTEAEKQNKGWTVKDGKWQANVAGINWRQPGFEQTPEHPVVLVTWNDAKAFTAWLSKLSGRDIRLPTEAQWENAARGPQSLKYPWGDKWDGIVANVADASLRRAGLKGQLGEINEDDGYPFTSPGGAYKNASWCGAFDMAGNVWQWCEDYFNDKYYGESPAVDPRGPANGGDRVVRGGCWDIGPCRSARRRAVEPGGRTAAFGFRVVVEPAKAP